MPMDEDQLSDAYLVVAAKAGERSAAELLVRRWQRKLLAHAWRLSGDTEAARDAVQDAWRDILRGLDRLKDEQAFPAWAFRIVSRICARQARRSARRRNVTEALSREPPDASDAFEDGDPDIKQLRVALRQLPPDQRAAVALFYFEDLSVAEVAVAMNIPIGTAKTRLMHARRKLHALLQGDQDAQY